MREHTRAFQAELKQLGNTGENKLSPEWTGRLSVLLVFDFEAAIRLGDWDELESICGNGASFQNPDTLRALGDSLLRAQADIPSKSK